MEPFCEGGGGTVTFPNASRILDFGDVQERIKRAIKVGGRTGSSSLVLIDTVRGSLNRSLRWGPQNLVGRSSLNRLILDTNLYAQSNTTYDVMVFSIGNRLRSY